MSIIIWLIMGGIVGWLASLIMKTDAQQGIFLNVLVGIVGASLGGFLLGGSLNTGMITFRSFVVSLLGAVALLALINLIRRGRAR